MQLTQRGKDEKHRRIAGLDLGEGEIGGPVHRRQKGPGMKETVHHKPLCKALCSQLLQVSKGHTWGDNHLTPELHGACNEAPSSLLSTTGDASKFNPPGSQDRSHSMESV